MTYKNISRGIFLSRPNRFIANVEINGQVEIVHVKNTGRCKELLIPGTTVYLESHDNIARKTKFSLIAVEKGKILINIDSQAPNYILYEALTNNIKIPRIGEILSIKKEAIYGSSRLDFYVESKGKDGLQKAYIEVKGVTLENDGLCLFPDAPTERGVKHINELIHAVTDGYLGYIVFVIQMKGVKCFSPNDNTHPAFGDALRDAANRGVSILAYDCDVATDEIKISTDIPIIF